MYDTLLVGGAFRMLADWMMDGWVGDDGSAMARAG